MNYFLSKLFKVIKFVIELDGGYSDALISVYKWSLFELKIFKEPSNVIFIETRTVDIWVFLDFIRINIVLVSDR